MGKRLFIRVPEALYKDCEARGVPSSVARDMICDGLRGPIGHIKLVPGPYRWDFNLWLPDDVIATIKQLAERESVRLGVKVDNGAVARWLIARGIERGAQTDPIRKTG